MRSHIPELLAPAGGPLSFKAAVQNGANAIYIGLSSFSARASAENFSVDNLKTWVDYAHLRGVSVHVAINTCLGEREVAEAVRLAHLADEAGVNAFIIQDLGLAGKLAGRTKAKLHASTQLTIYNTQGLEFIKNLGFSRAVLARELPIEEISEIASAKIMETEVFCHGALCMSYSGQCMLSFSTCGRSGNRGTCSQPCRLKYALDDDKFSYRLSPMDLASIEYLDKLVNTGVDSLKIEGRLKSPEYVASVVRSYRHALDAIQNNEQNLMLGEDLRDMAVVFQRSGFSSGHQLGKLPLGKITAETPGKNGPEAGTVISPFEKLKAPVNIYKFTARLTRDLSKGDGITFDKKGDGDAPGGIINVIKIKGKETDRALKGEICEITIAGTVPKTSGSKIRISMDKKLMDELALSFKDGAELRKVKVDVVLKAEIGGKPKLIISDDSASHVEVEGNTIAESSEKTGSKEKLLDKVCAFGGTCFELGNAKFDGPDNIYINPGELKNMRREAVSKLSDLRINNFKGGAGK